VKQVRKNHKGPVVHYTARDGRVVREDDPVIEAPEAVIAMMAPEQAAELQKLMTELAECIQSFKRNEQLIWQFWAEWQGLKPKIVTQEPKRGRGQIRSGEGVGIAAAIFGSRR
jgi:hypothetical protein